ncbi:hypothetical protein PROFUN_13852 [Planoprotostelium fungivorum]|uniref:Uncharacterized protein n=1 Tax=Planoprotostelium fungivorum TaxID=1890364 RepID=A0A2P6N2T5_9EUKA|nr:hypothetical protein PROFUN_13852 [Planoprotostelium fungivorum]
MKNLAARVNIGLGQLKTYLMCNQDQLKTHLISHFHSRMSLMNYGVLWNLDHIIPAQVQSPGKVVESLVMHCSAYASYSPRSRMNLWQRQLV